MTSHANHPQKVRADYVQIFGDPRTGGPSCVIHWSSWSADSGNIIADTLNMRSAVEVAEYYCAETGAPFEHPGPYLISGGE